LFENKENIDNKKPLVVKPKLLYKLNIPALDADKIKIKILSSI
jgi:hypothetical protein